MESYNPIQAQQTIVQFMESYFGKVYAPKILALKMRERNISSLSTLQKDELVHFLDYLFDTFFSKYYLKEDIRFLKVALYGKIFGNEDALRITSDGTFKNVVNPIDYIFEVFGRNEAERILFIAKKKYGIKNIENSDDFNQILFLKRLFGSFFRHNTDLLHKINVGFLKYIKYGKKKFDAMSKAEDRFAISHDTKEHYLPIIDKIRDASEEELEKIMEAFESDSDREVLIDLGLIEDVNEDNNGPNSVGNRTVGLRNAVGMFMPNAEAADQYIYDEQQALGVTSILSSSNLKKAEFLNRFQWLDVVKNSSIQKQTLAVNKIKSIFGLK